MNKVKPARQSVLSDHTQAKPISSQKRSSLLSAFGQSHTVNGYFSPKLNTFFVVTPDPVEDKIMSYELLTDPANPNDIEHHAIWDMFSKILQEHSGENVEI